MEASKRFYAGALAPLGLGITGEGEGWFSADELFVSGDGPITSGLHVAFQAQDRETVDRFHAAAIEAGPLWATQFHPEKSGADGLRLLQNFVDAA